MIFLFLSFFYLSSHCFFFVIIYFRFPILSELPLFFGSILLLFCCWLTGVIPMLFPTPLMEIRSLFDLFVDFALEMLEFKTLLFDLLSMTFSLSLLLDDFTAALFSFILCSSEPALTLFGEINNFWFFFT